MKKHKLFLMASIVGCLLLFTGCGVKTEELLNHTLTEEKNEYQIEADLRIGFTTPEYGDCRINYTDDETVITKTGEDGEYISRIGNKKSVITNYLNDEREFEEYYFYNAEGQSYFYKDGANWYFKVLEDELFSKDNFRTMFADKKAEKTTVNGEKAYKLTVEGPLSDYPYLIWNRVLEDYSDAFRVQIVNYYRKSDYQCLGTSVIYQFDPETFVSKYTANGNPYGYTLNTVTLEAGEIAIMYGKNDTDIIANLKENVFPVLKYEDYKNAMDTVDEKIESGEYEGNPENNERVSLYDGEVENKTISEMQEEMFGFALPDDIQNLLGVEAKDSLLESDFALELHAYYYERNIGDIINMLTQKRISEQSMYALIHLAEKQNIGLYTDINGNVVTIKDLFFLTEYFADEEEYLEARKEYAAFLSRGTVGSTVTTYDEEGNIISVE